MNGDDLAQRRARALTLKIAGLSHRGIAEQLLRDGYEDLLSDEEIGNDISVALAGLQQSTAEYRELFITLEAERLDGLQRSVETVHRSAAQQGRCSACGRSGDAGTVLKAASTMVRVMERRAALLGLDLKGKDQKITATGPMDELRKRRDNKLAQ